MKKKSLIQQAAVLSAANIATRGLGFVMRVFLSRRMGAEITGVLELASSAHMLWIAPVTAGIPMAVATETAAGRGQQALLAGKRLALRICMVLLPLLALGMPLIVHILGDLRTLPALLCYLPCLPILALSAAVNGYCYGAGDTLPPASSELFEQALRFLLCVLALSALPRLSAGFTAAIPAFATLVGEAAGLWLVLWMLRRNGVPLAGHRDREMEKKLWTLSVPMTWMRLSTAVTRTAGSIMIPLRLRASGLGIAEATARLGMLNGMAMPWVMLPGVFTGALAMVAGPAIARRHDRPGNAAFAGRAVDSLRVGHLRAVGRSRFLWRAVACQSPLPAGRGCTAARTAGAARTAVRRAAGHQRHAHRPGTPARAAVRLARRFAVDPRAGFFPGKKIQACRLRAFPPCRAQRLPGHQPGDSHQRGQPAEAS